MSATRPRPTLAPEAFQQAARRLVGAAPQDVLGWALQTFGPHLAIASSFSIEDCVVHDMASKIQRDVRVFALDTGRLHEETYQTAERIRSRYRTVIEWQFPDRPRVETLVRNKGHYSFMDSLNDRHECCGIRKVEPLRRMLSDLDAWVTGLRREQSVTRTDLAEIEIDEANGGLIKVNPLAAWTEAQVRAYAADHRVPVHPLHDRGYPSIGCAPCTRAIKPGDHPRAGRWWWENPDQKECGLHADHGHGTDGKA